MPAFLARLSPTDWLCRYRTSQSRSLFAFTNGSFGARLWSMTINSVGTPSPLRTDATVSSNNCGRLREQMMSVVGGNPGGADVFMCEALRALTPVWLQL